MKIKNSNYLSGRYSQLNKKREKEPEGIEKARPSPPQHVMKYYIPSTTTYGRAVAQAAALWYCQALCGPLRYVFSFNL